MLGGLQILKALTYRRWRTSRVCAVRSPNMMLKGLAISNEEVLATPADILVPAALGGVITPEVARDIQAKAVIEAANAPTDPEADEILNKRGIPVIPDILANAGGVTVSYFEWAQNIQCLRWTEEEVNQRLKHIMTSSYATVRKLKQHRNLTWRTAAFIVALGRVAKATVLRGI
jgi:glutamate dehydrogenase (NAD(P)+)